jgi:hypothetical protein
LTGANQIRDLAALVSTAINERLWADDDAGGDHYVTQTNLVNEKRWVTADFVDYDANLIALAYGVSEDAKDCDRKADADASQYIYQH